VHTTLPAEAVLPRALLLTALELPTLTLPSRWVATSRRELMLDLASRVGLETVDVDDAIRHQAELNAVVGLGTAPAGELAARRDEWIASLTAVFDAPLYETSVHGGGRDAGPGLRARLAEAEQGRVAAEQERLALLTQAEDAAGASQALRAELDAARERLATVEHANHVLHNSRSYRLTKPLRVGGRWLRTASRR
jgi:hypothetical protein